MSGGGSGIVRPWKLDPEAVRRRANGIEGCKEVPCNLNIRHQISYLVGLENDDKHQARNVTNLARVTIFADTGTVGICRVLNGEIRQVFKRNIATLDGVERILKQPPPLTVIDKNIVGLTDDDDDDDNDDNDNDQENNKSTGNNKNKKAKMSQSQMIRTEIELADVGIAILQGEKEKLENHLTAIQPLSSTAIAAASPVAKIAAALKKSPAATTAAAMMGGSAHYKKAPPPAAPPSSTSTTTSSQNQHDSKQNDDSLASSSIIQSGMEFQFSLPAQAMKHVDQCLNDINKMGKLVRNVSTNGRGTVFLYGNGGVAYTPNIPRHLHQKLSQLRNSRMASRPSYIALGTRDRYFVTFHNGSFSCKGPKGLDRELRKLTKPPMSVSFGQSWDTFFVVFSDGSWKLAGRTIPDDLEEKLAAREDRPDLVCCHLGPSGEWFLKTRSGRMWWGGISDEADAAIIDLLDSGHEINVLDFGEDGSYYVSYD